MNQQMTVAEILAHNQAVAGADVPLAALTDTQLLQHEAVQRLIMRTKVDTADEASAYFLHAMLLAIEHLASGNKLVAGRAFDDALTHFLADLKAELGDGFAANAAALLIRNIALFLPPPKRDMVRAALDVEAK